MPFQDGDTMNTVTTAKALLSLLALLTALPAGAGVATRATVEELARGSDAVVRGRVVSLSARRSSDGKRISTYAEVETDSVWRGSAPARVTVVVRGGVVGDIGEKVFGAPTFSQGEEVVVFLRKTTTEGRFYRVRGLAQGKFSVSGGQASPDLSGLTLPERHALRSGERRAEVMSVGELERRVRAAR
jgi:hypothetical protein